MSSDKKAKRDRLFKNGRPHIRPLQVYDGEKYHKDLGILWVGYKKTPFEWLKENLEQSEFARAIEHIYKDDDLLIAEDNNRHFKDKKGPVALFSLSNNGWKYEPHVQFMPWATKKNILRATVAFLQYVRYSKKVGCVVVFSLEDSLTLFDKCCEYGVLHRVGLIPNGDPRGDEWMYTIRGKREHVKSIR